MLPQPPVPAPEIVALATPSRRAPLCSDDTRGMLLGLAGVAIFSLTLPCTRLVVRQLDPAFVACGRAVVAALLAAIWLRCRAAPLPPRHAWGPLLAVTIGCVLGFPWLTSIAMRSLPASHGAVLVGILPLATAVAAVLRGGERPSAAFWAAAVAGSALVIGFALRQGGGHLQGADWLLLLAVALAALGYAEGGRLATSLGGEQVISWALLLALPVTMPACLLLCWRAGALPAAGLATWSGFAYLSLMSMFIGFFFWYRGMALGGVVRVGQTQLLQPFLSLASASVLLGEPFDPAQLLYAGAVIALVAAGRRLRVARA